MCSETAFNAPYSSFVRVKICGMRDKDSVSMAVKHGADAVGFITEVPVNTHRKIDRETARELAASVPPFVTSIMVFMPDDLKNALELIDFVKPDAVQVHSAMSIDELVSLKAQSRVKIIKTINIIDETSVRDTLDYITALKNIVDAVLLDSSVGGKSGGTGVVHDWTKSRDITVQSPLPVILAGGLHSGNVADAISTVRPFGVDTVSGVETDRKIDDEKVKMFMKNARGQ
ncbi:MAG: phosphoribosylanthranilate isomerase [Methanosarcinales archaeon]|nr:phosphoribosylanthranilate isomerase [Methanosarcinales archaeon]